MKIKYLQIIDEMCVYMTQRNTFLYKNAIFLAFLNFQEVTSENINKFRSKFSKLYCLKKLLFFLLDYYTLKNTKTKFAQKMCTST